MSFVLVWNISQCFYLTTSFSLNNIKFYSILCFPGHLCAAWYFTAKNKPSHTCTCVRTHGPAEQQCHMKISEVISLEGFKEGAHLGPSGRGLRKRMVNKGSGGRKEEGNTVRVTDRKEKFYTSDKRSEINLHNSQLTWNIKASEICITMDRLSCNSPGTPLFPPLAPPPRHMI